MKAKLMFMVTILLSNSAQAQIFRCDAVGGKVVYQDKPCAESSKQKQVAVQHLDPEIIREAQEKLERDLQQRAQIEAARAEQERKEREIAAMEAQARSNEELANAARENAYAIEKNTEAVRYGSQRSNVYYYNPPRKRPRPEHRPEHHQPVTKPGGRKSAASIKFTVK